MRTSKWFPMNCPAQDDWAFCLSATEFFISATYLHQAPPQKKMNAVMLSHTYRPRYVMHLRSEFIAVKFRTVWEGKDQVSRYFPRLNCGGKQLLVVAVERCMVPSYIHTYIHEFRDKATHSTHSIASNLPVAMSCAPVSVAASTMTWAFSSLKA